MVFTTQSSVNYFKSAVNISKKTILKHLKPANSLLQAWPIMMQDLRPWLLLLLLEKGKQRHTRDLDNLEPDTRNISNSVTLTTKSSNQHFILGKRQEKRIHIVAAYRCQVKK
jgi:hypothetical protein